MEDVSEMTAYKFAEENKDLFINVCLVEKSKPKFYFISDLVIWYGGCNIELQKVIHEFDKIEQQFLKTQ